LLIARPGMQERKTVADFRAALLIEPAHDHRVRAIEADPDIGIDLAHKRGRRVVHSGVGLREVGDLPMHAPRSTQSDLTVRRLATLGRSYNPNTNPHILQFNR
jgi:hypothetical protein